MEIPSPGWSGDEVIAHLASLRSPENLEGMARFGIRTDRAFGVGLAVLRPLARKIRRDHERAEALWQSGWREARLLAAFTDEPGDVTPDQARRWAGQFDSWEIVDGVVDLFVATPFWRELVDAFAADEREFVRRAAFSMIARAAVSLKAEDDATFLAFLPLIERHAGDPRNFVKKAVNWALRQIGKRSHALHGPALALAGKLAASNERAARWIGNDAVRELRAAKTIASLDRCAGRPIAV